MSTVFVAVEFKIEVKETETVKRKEREYNEESNCRNGRKNYVAVDQNNCSLLWAKVIRTKKLADLSNERERSRASHLNFFKPGRRNSASRQDVLKHVKSLEYASLYDFIGFFETWRTQSSEKTGFI